MKIKEKIVLKSCAKKNCDVESLGKHTHDGGDVLLINDEKQDLEIIRLEGKNE